MNIQNYWQEEARCNLRRRSVWFGRCIAEFQSVVSVGAGTYLRSGYIVIPIEWFTTVGEQSERSVESLYGPRGPPLRISFFNEQNSVYSVLVSISNLSSRTLGALSAALWPRTIDLKTLGRTDQEFFNRRSGSKRLSAESNYSIRRSSFSNHDRTTLQFTWRSRRVGGH